MRKTTALIAAIALLGGLTACAGSGTNSCTPVVASGDASSAVTATGRVGIPPTVKFPTPLYTKTNEKSELRAGHGQPIQEGQPVILDVSIFNGATGKVLQKTSYSDKGGSIVTAGKSTFPALSEGLRCSTAGSRFAVVGSPKDSHRGQADQTNAINKNDSFVYVVDVKKSFLARADGADQIPQNGMPAVVLTADGTPGISIPNESAPRAVKISVLKKGSGAKLTAHSFAVVKSTGLAWADRTVFESSWTDHQATVIQLGSQSVATGLSKALTGQRVGSQVLVVLPPKENTVPDGSGKAPADATAVYAVDILGVVQ